MPDDFIMRRGEVDEEFYMISRGSVELSTGPDSFERPVGSADSTDEGEASNTTGDRSASSSSPRRVSAKVTGSSAMYQTHARDSTRSVREREGVFTSRSVEREAAHPVTKSPELTPVEPKFLTKGQAFGELALLMNYQRTADVRAITYVEMCVLGRKDFQRILTSHPEDRKKVVSSMLTTCMVNNDTEGVFCPLKDMVRSVYSSVDPMRGAQISTLEAAALIVDVINPDLEDKSIKFGVSTKLQQRLLRRRDSKSKTEKVSAAQSTLSTAQAPNGTDRLSLSQVSEERIEQSLEALTKMMHEMRLAINQVSALKATTEHCTCSKRRPSMERVSSFERRTSIESPRLYSRMFKTDSTASLDMSVDAANERQQSHQSKDPDHVAQLLQQQSVRELWVTDVAGAGDTAIAADANAPSQGTPHDLSPRVVQRRPLLKTRMSTFGGTGSTHMARKYTAPSPTQFADQLFQNKPRPLFFRHSAQSLEPPHSASSAAITSCVVGSIIDDDDGSGDDSFLKILSKGQAFGEMALLVNCQRTADVPAITYVEMCVLNRSDFQRILTTHPEDRKKVLFAMLSTCMVANEAKGVNCPLIGMVRSVYSGDGGMRIGAEEAAALILDVINSDVEDTSIRVAPPTNVAQHTDATRSSTEDPHHHRRLSRSASSIAVADGIDASKLQQQSRQSESHDDAAQTTNPQRSFRKLWVTDRAVNDSTSANSPGQLSTGGVSPTSAQRHPPLKSRLSAVSSST
ncbi:hypothetical protein Gpo141_00009153 [Globisporangium polare]